MWSLKLVVTRSGIVYGIFNVHKDIAIKCPLFGPILFTVNTPTYKLAKLVPILKIEN